MNLFQMENWNLTISEQTWGLVPFKKLLDKDKSPEKERAIKEVTFVWFYCDIKSDYQYILNPEERAKEIKKDLKLPSAWKITKDVQAAIDFYRERSTTTSSKIFEDSMYIANTLSSKLRKIVDDEDTNPNTYIKLIDGLKKMPELIKTIKQAEKEVLKEISENKKNIGSQQKGMFEEGFKL